MFPDLSELSQEALYHVGIEFFHRIIDSTLLPFLADRLPYRLAGRPQLPSLKQVHPFNKPTIHAPVEA